MNITNHHTKNTPITKEFLIDLGFTYIETDITNDILKSTRWENSSLNLTFVKFIDEDNPSTPSWSIWTWGNQPDYLGQIKTIKELLLLLREHGKRQGKEQLQQELKQLLNIN